MIAQKTIRKVKAAEFLVKLIRQPARENRIELANLGLRLLKRVEPVNGEAKQIQRAANRLASALRIEYENPAKAMEAATVATELRSFARGMAPMVDTLCLA